MQGIKRTVPHHFVTYQIRLPQALAHAEELFTRRAADNEVLGEIDTADRVETADEGLSALGLETRNDRADEVGAKPALVQRRRNEVGEGRGRDVALLAQTVHVDLVSEEVGDGCDIRGESRQAEEDIAVLEDLGEVVGYCEGLETEAQVAGDSDTVLAYHGHAGTAICRWKEEL